MPEDGVGLPLCIYLMTTATQWARQFMQLIVAAMTAGNVRLIFWCTNPLPPPPETNLHGSLVFHRTDGVPTEIPSGADRVQDFPKWTFWMCVETSFNKNHPQSHGSD